MTVASPRPVRDLGIRLAVSPLLGLLISALSGLVTPVRHSARGLIATYIYFSVCAFVIWTSNRWLYLRLPRREDWLEFRPLFTDELVFIEPDSHPGGVVKILHVADVQVAPGDRVVAGETVLAAHPHQLPFGSQVDDYRTVATPCLGIGPAAI